MAGDSSGRVHFLRLEMDASLASLAAESENPLSLLSEGLSLVRQGREAAAMSCWQKAVKLRPDAASMIWGNVAKALSQQGEALWNTENYEGALSSYETALNLQPDNANIWDNRGYALFTLGRYNEAITSYQKALELDSNPANAYYNIACLYGLQGDVDLAIQNLQQAIKLDSEYREIAKTDSDFDSIRGDSRFQALLEE